VVEQTFEFWPDALCARDLLLKDASATGINQSGTLLVERLIQS
jgi:hypothetical protein